MNVFVVYDFVFSTLGNALECVKDDCMCELIRERVVDDPNVEDLIRVLAIYSDEEEKFELWIDPPYLSVDDLMECGYNSRFVEAPTVVRAVEIITNYYKSKS